MIISKNILLLTAISVISIPPISVAQWVYTDGPTGTGLLGTGVVHALTTTGSAIFAGCNGGVFRLADNDSTWVQANSGGTNGEGICLATRWNLIFEGTYGNGVFLSTDEGATWTTLGPSGTWPLGFAFSGTDLFVGIEGGVLRSTNDGSNWAQVNSGLPPTTSSHMTYVYKIAIIGGDIFACTNGVGIFRSTDNGNSWTQVDSALINTLTWTLATTDSTLYVGSDKWVFSSTDKGVTWIDASEGLEATPNAVYTIYASGGNLFAGTDKGVFLSTNNGATWTDVNTGFPSGTWVTSFATFGADLYAGTGSGVWRRSLSEMTGATPPPALVLSQLAIAFGSVQVDSDRTDTLKITNTSSAALIVDSVYTRTSWFSVTPVHEAVSQADTIELVVTFTPDTARDYSDTLCIASKSTTSVTRCLCAPTAWQQRFANTRRVFPWFIDCHRIIQTPSTLPR